MYSPKLSVIHDFRGQEYVCETTRSGNVTTKRHFNVIR